MDTSRAVEMLESLAPSTWRIGRTGRFPKASASASSSREP